jgi:hypothetical protein
MHANVVVKTSGCFAERELNFGSTTIGVQHQNLIFFLFEINIQSQPLQKKNNTLSLYFSV